jgi:thioredoxin 1
MSNMSSSVIEDPPRSPSRSRRLWWGLAVSALLTVAVVWYWFRGPHYSTRVDAHAQIREAEQKAATEHKRVLVIFGANWCYDCHVLNQLFRRPELASVLAENYEVVHVDVGAGDKNQDLMTEYHVPMDQGISSVAILESDGTLIYSQKDGEFENTRRLTVEKLLDFLEEWKLKAIIRSSYLLESAGRGRVPNLLRSCPVLSQNSGRPQNQ